MIHKKTIKKVKKKVKKATRLIDGQKKSNTNSLRGRKAGTSSRNKDGKQVGSRRSNKNKTGKIDRK